jgi:large subunit ribosomal protein L15
MATNLSNLKPAKGSKFTKKRVGRGPGSGSGKTAARGYKGAQSRSGYKSKRGFEGGQMPLHRRMPKRGFNNIFRIEYAVVNLDAIAETLRAIGLVSDRRLPIKVLARGEVSKSFTVQAHKFSGKAAEKIAAAGGTVEVLGKPAA